MEKLAALGGSSVRESGAWPTWPSAPPGVDLLLRRALESGRWTLRSPWTDGPSLEAEFCAAFGRFAGASFASTAPSGTLALRLALEACDIGFGDEVIMPALTWVAPAIAITQVNAVPILVDVDPETYCISPPAIEAAITSRTRAIMPVHYFCGMAEMDALARIAAKHDLLVIEDAAQAHGAEWRGRHAGTLGDVGCFSFHGEKLLTSGEGGIAITNNPDIYDRLQTLRLDGFRYSESPIQTMEGPWQVAGFGDVLGSSCCISEFQAAVLLAQLALLSAQTETRAASAQALDQLLVDSDAISPIRAYAGVSRRAYYLFAMHYHAEAAGGVSANAFATALSAELGFPVYPEGMPINKNVLYKPQSLRRYGQPALDAVRLLDQHPLDVSMAAPDRLLLFHHRSLLGEPEDVAAIAEAILKVERLPDQLRELDARGGWSIPLG